MNSPCSVRHRTEPASRGVSPLFRVRIRNPLAPVLVGRAPHALGLRWASGVPRAPAFRSCQDKTEAASHELACSYRVPRARDGRPALPRPRGPTKQLERLPPLRFSPLQRFPAHDSSMMAGFASPNRLRPQVFSTSRRLHPPRACRPCFMPDPLMGFCPPKLCSSRAAVRRLRRRSPLAVG